MCSEALEALRTGYFVPRASLPTWHAFRQGLSGANTSVSNFIAILLHAPGQVLPHKYDWKIPEAFLGGKTARKGFVMRCSPDGHSAFLQGTSDAIVSKATLALFHPCFLSKGSMCTSRSLRDFSYRVRCQAPVLTEDAAAFQTASLATVHFSSFASVRTRLSGPSLVAQFHLL